MATWKGSGGTRPVSRVGPPNKLWHAFKHKNFDIFKFDLDAEEDQNYVQASERFLEFQAQVGMVLHHSETFRRSLEESLQQGVELADDFGRISAGQGGGRVPEAWAHKAGGQAFFLKGMLEESVASLRQYLYNDLEEKLVRPLRDEFANFTGVQGKMVERSNMKMEMLHYSNKVHELKANQKATDEKKDRNKEKYAQASQALRDQTNQLMSTFAHAEQVRQRLLTQDLPTLVLTERNAFDAFAINLNKAAAEAIDGEPRPPRMSDAARAPHRLMPASDFPTTPTETALVLAEVSLEDGTSQELPPAYSSPYTVKVEPPPPAEDAKPTIIKKRSPLPVSPKETGAPWSSSNGGGEFGAELKRAQEHQNSKMAAESAAATTSAANTAETVASVPPGVEDGADEVATPTAVSLGPTAATYPSAAEDADPSMALEHSPPASTEMPFGEDASPPPFEESIGVEESEPVGEDEGAEMPELAAGKVRVRALYDYEATQEGDLSFSAGDMIVTDGGSFSGDGWVSGECNGSTGIFPANYTEPW